MRLSELLDMAVIQKLAEANFDANGMPIGILDADGNVLVGRGWQDICTRFHRVHPESARRCHESDAYIKDHLSESAACEYTCKNGLRDIGVPIVVEGEHVATLFLGQFFYEGESPDREYFVRQANEFGYDEDDYLVALGKVPTFSRRSVDHIVAYDRALAGFIAELAESALRHERDRRALRESEERFRVLTGLYAVLSEVNEAIVRTRDEPSLYQDVCRIVAEEGGFPLVWVGLVDERQIVPAAWSGPASDYLARIRVEVDGELGMGPTGTCVREDRTVINDDFDRNEATAPWRVPALRHGLRASAAFPLRREGRVFGALTLYASSPGAFTPERIDLLDALCADVSYALDAIDQDRRRRQAEEALRESERGLRDADRHKNEFLGVLSHELRNPLAPIRNALYILDRAPAGGEQASRAKAIIGRQVDHLTRLVGDLLDVTRIARGKIQLQRSRFDLGELVKGAAEDHRALLVERDIELDLRIAAGPLHIHGDQTRIAQVVSNLLQNSAKFTDPGGRVVVVVQRDGAAASVGIADSGIGIAPEMLERVFEPFTQADDSLHRTRGGLGLGLALVKGLVELHGGEIEVRSEGAGRGAAFTVRLPLAAADRGATNERPARRTTACPRRILVIEDNVDAAETLAEMLRMEGHEVAVVHDGRGGVERARASKPEIVLCDIGLPELDGYGVARALRSDATLATTLLVALTGYALPDDQLRAREAGFDHHLAKPVPFETLERLIATARG
jgi:signal transduction histidine kinase/ligand-binding sensor protein